MTLLQAPTMQKDRFFNGEGDAWFRRNRVALADIDAVVADDPVIELEHRAINRAHSLRP